jgi:hypothetical protein
MDEHRNASKPAVVLKIGKGGKYEFAGKIYPEGMAPPAGEPAPAPGPKKTEAETTPNSAQAAANTGQPGGVPSGEHPKK